MGLSRLVVDFLGHELSAEQAAKEAVRILKDKVNGDGRIILMDRKGDIGYHFNTPHMAVGAATLDEILFVKIKTDEVNYENTPRCNAVVFTKMDSENQGKNHFLLNG